ncbi:NADPH:quinone reductase-like Zn-dependent oxidoreductase [Bradyrhizobium sp. USDA 4504]
MDGVVEVGGAGTISQSLTVAGDGGKIALIGVLGGCTQEIAISTAMILGKNSRLTGMSVGGRTEFEQMARAIANARLKPVIDKRYSFEEVPLALKRIAENSHVGKICNDFCQ